MQTTYKNPVAVKGDFADPFVLRYNGRYYLYCTNPDIRCWSSENLLDWRLEGASIATDTFPDLVPFAPEVVYSNGCFYMYTSPSGYGHYVLKSETPIGPFRKISENVQHAIDGSIFIDDDGTWYFYWAGEEGIWGCKMNSPVEFGEPVLTGAYMHGWTEGPLVCKQDGIYYMTYTGNHYLSKGYRINAAWSTHPLKGYQDEKNNPIVIHTKGEGIGLGHSSTVIGPDLISHYLVYHNMNEDRSRDLNIDRQLWSGQVTQILGPTRTPQPAPKLPDYSFPTQSGRELKWQFKKGSWEREKDIFFGTEEGILAVSEQTFDHDFTAEFNLIISEKSGEENCGILLLESAEQYHGLVFDENTHSLQLWHCKDGNRELIKQSKLPQDYVFQALHCVRTEYKDNGILSVFVDQRFQLQQEINVDSLRIGYFSKKGKIGCGYTAVTECVVSSNSEAAILPEGCAYYPVFGVGRFDREQDGSIFLREGQEAEYHLIAEAEADYKLFITGSSIEDSSTAEVLIDNKVSGLCSGMKGVRAFQIKLSAGTHSLKIREISGEQWIKGICFIRSEDKEEKPVLPLKAGPYGKQLFGAASWSDYTIKAGLRIEFKSENSKAGVLLRVTEPSEGGEGEDSVLGIHFFIGYSVVFTGKEIVVSKHRYDEQVIAACPYDLESNQFCELEVSILGAEIRVYVNKEQVPRITVSDLDPIAYGSAGIWAQDSFITLEELNINR